MKVADILTHEELMKLERIEKKIDKALTTWKIKRLLKQSDEIFNQAKIRYFGQDIGTKTNTFRKRNIIPLSSKKS